MSGVSDDPNSYCSVPAEELPLDLILPSSADYQSLAYNFSVLVSRVLVKKLPYFNTTFHDVFIQHLPNEHSEEMAQKSETVCKVYFICTNLSAYMFQIPLGVILENENEIDGMINIMDEIHKYIPQIAFEAVDGVTKKPIPAHKVHKVLFGGDMLTRKRAETAIECRQNSTTLLKQLKGVHPVCEDWHAKKCLLEVYDHSSILFFIHIYNDRNTFYMCVLILH